MDYQNDISPQAQKAILEQEIALWKNTRYQWEVRHRVLTRIGASKDELSEVMSQLERCEKALDLLNEELTGIDSLEY